MRYAGDFNEELNLTLVEQVAGALWTDNTKPEDIERQIIAAIIQLREIKAGDVIAVTSDLARIRCGDRLFSVQRIANANSESRRLPGVEGCLTKRGLQ